MIRPACYFLSSFGKQAMMMGRTFDDVESGGARSSRVGSSMEPVNTTVRSTEIMLCFIRKKGQSYQNCG